MLTGRPGQTITQRTPRAELVSPKPAAVPSPSTTAPTPPAAIGGGKKPSTGNDWDVEDYILIGIIILVVILVLTAIGIVIYTATYSSSSSSVRSRIPAMPTEASVQPQGFDSYGEEDIGAVNSRREKRIRRVNSLSPEERLQMESSEFPKHESHKEVSRSEIKDEIKAADLPDAHENHDNEKPVGDKEKARTEELSRLRQEEKELEDKLTEKSLRRRTTPPSLEPSASSEKPQESNQDTKTLMDLVKQLQSQIDGMKSPAPTQNEKNDVEVQLKALEKQMEALKQALKK